MLLNTQFNFTNKMTDERKQSKVGAIEDHRVREPPRKLSLSFSNVRFETTKGKVLLNDVTGYVGAGDFCGILGPSGSGKTCLLDVLAMRKKKGGLLKEGRVLYGGRPIKSRTKGDALCYIGQEDVLLSALTVRETVTFAVRLEYGFSLPRASLESLVNAILDDIGLRSSASVMVGNPITGKGISGGQRRRLMIAVELVSCPAVMILDEPTSGLDFASAYGIMQELQGLAKIGHTVITVIHQPSSQIWSLFSKVGFLSQGSLVYFGSPEQLLTYFEGLGHVCPEFFNPAEFVMELLNPTSDLEVSENDSLRDAFNKSSILASMKTIIAEETAANSRDSKYDTTGVPMLTTDAISKPNQINVCTSSTVLLHRNMLDLIRNPSLLLSRLVLTAVITFLMGLTYFRIGDRFNDEAIRSRSSALFFLPSFTALVSVAVIPYFISNRAVIKKEIGNGRYSVWAYALSFIVPTLLCAGTIAIINTLISYYMLGFRNFGQYFLVMLANYTLVEFMVLASGAIVTHYLVGMLLVIAIMASGMATQGFFIVFDRINPSMRWLGYITPQRYMYRALMRNEFETMGNLTSLFYPTGEDYLDYFGFNNEAFQNYWIDMAIVLLFILAFVSAFLAALRTWQS